MKPSHIIYEIAEGVSFIGLEHRSLGTYLERLAGKTLRFGDRLEQYKL